MCYLVSAEILLDLLKVAGGETTPVLEPAWFLEPSVAEGIDDLVTRYARFFGNIGDR